MNLERHLADILPLHDRDRVNNMDRKIPTRGSNVPVGSGACRVPHWSGGPVGRHFPVITENQ